MRPPSYRQRLFLEHYLGESSGSAVDAACRAGYPWPESSGRNWSRKVRETRSSSSQKRSEPAAHPCRGPGGQGGNEHGGSPWFKGPSRRAVGRCVIADSTHPTRCRMAISSNACALPDFPAFAQAVRYGVLGTHRGITISGLSACHSRRESRSSTRRLCPHQRPKSRGTECSPRQTNSHARWRPRWMSCKGCLRRAGWSGFARNIWNAASALRLTEVGSDSSNR